MRRSWNFSSSMSGSNFDLAAPIKVTFYDQDWLVTSMEDLFTKVSCYLKQVRPEAYAKHSFYLELNGNILNRRMRLHEYNISWVDVNYVKMHWTPLKGGVHVYLPPNFARLVEEMLIKHPHLTPEEVIKILSMQVQAENTTDEEWEDRRRRANATMFNILDKGLYKMMAKSAWFERYSKDPQGFGEGISDSVCSFIENIAHAYFWFRQSDNYVAWSMLVFTLFTGKPVGNTVLRIINKYLGPSEVQASVGDVLKTLRTGFDTMQNLSDHPVIKKFVKLYNFLLVQGFLAKAGLTLEDDALSKLEKQTLQVMHSSRQGLWMAAFDVALFLAEKLWDFYETRDVSVFLHADGDYSAWLKECDRIVSLVPYVGNLEAHGTSYFSFVSDVDDCIEKGESYAKYTLVKSGIDSIYFRKRLGELHRIKASCITRRAAQEERQAPFGVLITGPSGVAKSTFTKLIFYFHGGLLGLGVEAHFKYTRNPREEHWTNFQTSCWCIQLDDIAFLNPVNTNEVDPSTSDVIHIGNNVPLNPPQASLDDKGKTPVRAKLLIATTNCEHLHADHFFWCPLAVRRRLPFVVDVKPKPQYAKADGMIDPSLLVPDPHRYPDYWHIVVKKLVPVMSQGRENAKLEIVREYDDINEFLTDYSDAVLEYERVQKKAMTCDSYMKDISVCREHHKPAYVCGCMTVQADEQDQSSLPPEANWPARNRNSLQKCIWDCLLDFLKIIWGWYVRLYLWQFSWSWHLWLLGQLLKFQCMRYYVYQACTWFLPEAAYVRVVGIINQISTAPKRWRELSKGVKIVIQVLGLSVTAGTLYYTITKKDKKKTKVVIPEAVKAAKGGYDYVYQIHERERDGEYFTSEVAARKKIPEGEEVVKSQVTGGEPFLLQGNMYSTTEEQLEKEERNNVWYNSTLETTKFDLPLATQSLVGKNASELRELFGANVVKLDLWVEIPEGKRHKSVNGVFVSGQYLLFNNHAIPPRGVDDEVHIKLIQSRTNEGISGNLEFTLLRSDFVTDKALDVSMIKVLDLPPKKDILKFWIETDFHIGRYISISRANDGTVITWTVDGVQKYDEFPVAALSGSFPILRGTADRISADGDCGSLCIASVPRGSVLCGLHLLGRNRAVGSIVIHKADILALMKRVDSMDLITLKIQGGGEPLLKSSTCEKRLTPLSHRSTLRYLPGGVLNVYGSIDGFRARPKSSVCATPLQAIVEEHYSVKNDHGKPCMRGWEPWKLNLENMVRPHCSVHRQILKQCAESYVDDIISNLPERWEAELCFLSNRASVNGLPGVKYIDGINRSSSMGFPWNTTKKSYLEGLCDEIYPDGVDFGPEVWERVEYIEKLHAEGKRAYPVFTANLKDTPTPEKKIKMKKTRIFTGAPIDFSLVTRKKLLSFVRLVQKNKFAFEAGPGTVCQSCEWGEIRAFMLEFGEDRCFAGDYGWYDKRMIATFILMAFEVIAAIHKRAGFTDDEVQQIMAIGYDTAFSLCNFDGDLVEFFGTNPSGHALTVIINSIVNSLYMRYCFAKLSPDGSARRFRELVRLFTYGDDNMGSVHEDAPWFNHTSIQAVLATIGVEYTMADKKTESVPYIKFSEISFLKRTWLWSDDVQDWLCPLDEASIQKMLMVWCPSKTLTSTEQMVEAITCANNEYFFYGKEKFLKEHLFLKELLMQHPYSVVPKSSELPTWEELCGRYREASDYIRNQRLPKDQRKVWLPPVVNQKSQNNNDEEFSTSGATADGVAALERCAEPFIETNNQQISMDVQSEDTLEVTMPNMDAGATEESQNVTFLDNAEGESMTAPSPSNPVAMVDGTADLQLGSFLARPTLINATTWTTSDLAGLKTTITPWYAFLNNSVIKKKLDNFAFMRGRLHIKIVINGTPFQYGALRACYYPLRGFYTQSKIRGTGLEALVPYSQLPGVFIYPQANAGAEMTLPFFYLQNWLDITRQDDTTNFGSLYYYIFSPLQVAVSGGSTSVTVQTYAWMEEAELMASTSKLALQADEYVTGPVSGPATALASIADTLTKVPIIGKFARATSIGAGAVSRIASLFGYTNVPVIDDVHAFHPMNAPMLASANIGTPVQKLTLDPKQELSIDPSLHGLATEDELSINYLKQKESFFGQTVWQTTDIVDTNLFVCRVNPMLWARANIQNVASATVGQTVWHTPLSYLGMMFKNWRGSLKIRVKIIATKFHKGRLKISFDPRNDISTTSAPENTVYTQIVDIGEQDDVEFVIPYQQARAWLSVANDVTADNWNLGNSLPLRNGFDNGLFTVRVLTNLTAPAASSVGLLFFVSGGPDFEFANPSDHLGNSYTEENPSFFDLQAEDHVELTSGKMVMGQESKPHPDRYGLNFGECICSLRNILHRYSVSDTIRLDDNAAGSYTLYIKTYKHALLSPGYIGQNISTSANKVVAASGTAPYAFVAMHPIAYISAMFAAYRGSLNFVLTPSADRSFEDVRVVRQTQIINTTSEKYRIGATADSLGIVASQAGYMRFSNCGEFGYKSGNSGMGITATRTNTSLMFNLPDFKKENFFLSDFGSSVAGLDSDGSKNQGAMLRLTYYTDIGATAWATRASLQTEAAAGPDYTCLFFLCCPTLTYATALPAAA